LKKAGFFPLCTRETDAREIQLLSVGCAGLLWFGKREEGSPMLRTLSKSLLLAPPVAMLVVFSSGCGSSNECSDDGGGSGVGETDSGVGETNSGVDETEAIANLTDAEKTQICDWVASLYGGYGNSMTCPDGTPVIGPSTQADCLAQTTSIRSGCAATVAQEESCMQAVRACAQDENAAAAACSALHACYLGQ
jgi:hypothetical protein